MQLEALENLRQKMVEKNIQHQKFSVKTGAVEFDCVFSVKPLELSMTSVGTKAPEFFRFKLQVGCVVKTYLNEDYGRLVKLLTTHGRSKNKFWPKDWFSSINDQIPNGLMCKTNGHSPRQLHQNDPLMDRPYFSHWKILPNGQNVTKENYEKTLLILGEDAANYSK